ncbi:porin [Azorhizobium doebereinerae]|uniref:porin n=1 Tax=Azorhizobium doebereinerae TaxID=281091 RepID=UPI00042232E6|nr:porin [Azorhizobium doebereinerae]
MKFQAIAAGCGLVALASGLSGAPGARAADLPVKAQGAAQGTVYVRQCTAYGPGFYYIPGTETCLRIGGYLWGEGYYNSYTDYPAANNKTYSIATAGLILDARTDTEYGTLRSYFEGRFRWRTSDPWSDGPNGSEMEVWNAYIQFAGFTFGHAQSFFDFYANANVLGTDPATIGDDTRINLLAYTAEFAEGVSATLSLEDASDRLGGVLPQDPALPDALSDYQAGVTAPDVVGNLRIEGKWGAAQLSGALHQVRSLTQADLFTTTDRWGYALQGGVMVNLPMLGEGDNLYLQTAYADGAMSYLGLQDPSGAYAVPDAYLGPAGLSLLRGWNVTGQVLHNWNDKWSTALFAGYAAFEVEDGVAQLAYGASGGRNWNVGGNLAWTPVANLTIAIQYDYTAIELNNAVATDFSPALASTKAHRGLLYVARAF